MKRIAVIIGVTYLAFSLEALLFYLFGSWGKPELLMLVVIFFNLYLGIRYSIIAAVMAGLLKDTIAVVPFGTYVVIYLVAAYVTTFVRRYFYQPGSHSSRVFVTFWVVLTCFGMQMLLTMMSYELRVKEVLGFLFLPQLITTIIAATWVFAKLRDVSVFFLLKK